ncbi:MAG: outer membrane beta-barrel protein [Crocinitomicaceae bacterium]|nr:outer membrane beta-barrel protein [Crocinitomicaceae bacterium]
MAQRTFELDLLGGVTASQISGDGATGFNQFGIQLGGLLTLSIGENADIVSGIVWNQKGARTQPSMQNVVTYHLRANYIEIPMLFRYNYKKYFMEIGPTVNVLAGVRERTSFEAIKDRPFRPLELAGIGSLGYQINEKLIVASQFQNSLIPVRPHLNDFTIPPGNIIIADWHSRLYELGQYYTSISLHLRYRLK